MKKYLVIIACVFLTFTNCKKEDFVIDDTCPPVVLKTAQSSENLSTGDTLYFSNKSGYIEYNLNLSSNQELISCVFKYDDQTYEMTEPSGSFNLPYRSDVEKKLLCETEIKSGDKTFSFEYSWAVDFVISPEGSILYPKINSDGFLELSWNKAPVYKENFKRYILYVSNDTITEITNIDQTSYIVKSYCGGACSFTAKMIYINEQGNEESLSLGNVHLNQDIVFNYDYSEKDSISVCWINKYKATTSVTFNNETILTSKDNNGFVKIPYATFGVAVIENLKFAFSPYNEDEIVPSWSQHKITIDVNTNPGICFFSPMYGGTVVHYTDVAYNMIEDVLYMNYNSRDGFRLSSIRFPLTGTIYVDQNAIGGQSLLYQIVPSYINNKMLIMLTIYSGKDFNIDYSFPSLGRAALTNDNKVLSFEIDSIKVYNIDGSIFKKNPITVDLSNITISSTFISPDAKYIYFSNSNSGSVFILTLDDYSITNTKELTGSYIDKWRVNPLNSKQLFVLDGNNLKEYNGEDLSLSYEWDLSNYADMKMGNIDPKTEYLLIYNSSHALIIDTETKKIVLDIDITGTLYQFYYLYSNTLISAGKKGGYALSLD